MQYFLTNDDSYVLRVCVIYLKLFLEKMILIVVTELYKSTSAIIINFLIKLKYIL